MRDKPSSTALLIAASLRLQQLDGIAAACLPAEYLALAHASLSNASPGWKVLSGMLRWQLVRRALCRLEQVLLPGIQIHYLLRKQRLWVWIEQAHAQGFRQLLVFGAGCDGLGLAFARLGDTQVVELDHPATQALKRAALLSPGLSSPNLRLKPVDLAHSRTTADLQIAGLNADVPTLIVAEGLLMYLPLRRCARLLRSLLAGFRAPLRLAFSVMEPDPRGNPGFAQAHPAISAWMAKRGEPFQWAMRPEELRCALNRRGLRTLASHDPEIPPQPMLRNWTACPGEYLVLVERAAQRSSQVMRDSAALHREAESGKSSRRHEPV